MCAPILTTIPGLEHIYYIRSSFNEGLCFEFSKEHRNILEIAEKIFCQNEQESSENNTLLGFMPATNVGVRERRCVCKLLPKDQTSIHQRIKAVVAQLEKGIGVQCLTRQELYFVQPVLHLDDRVFIDQTGPKNESPTPMA